jgi:pyrroloquinoline quinone biosynthesis protein B
MIGSRILLTRWLRPWLAATMFILMAGLAAAQASERPYLIVLGMAQDGGVPQAGDPRPERWSDPAFRRLATSLALVDPAGGRRWLFDATPDFPAQLHRLDQAAPVPGQARPGLAGIFLTHAHIGHYGGLMFLGHEVMGAREVPVWAMPRMAEFLVGNGPWQQLVRYRNIALQPLAAGEAVELGAGLRVTPFLVPHRQEYSEVVGYRIEGPTASVLFIPDIDSWAQWDGQGVRIEDEIARVDVAYLDGTFHANGEIPGRDMSGFPHPFISASLERFAALPATQRARIRFIHLNHSNPAHWTDSDARRAVEAAGMRVAVEGERVAL